MSFLNRPLVLMKMGLRQHEALLAPVSDKVLEMLRKHDWTCHRCGVRIPDYMQVDHTAGHINQDPSKMRPICVFCHDQDHLIWAAARGRVVPVMGADLTHEQVSRLAWAVISLRGADDNLDAMAAAENVTAAFRKRHADFRERYGAEDADAAIEAAYRFRMAEEGEDERLLSMKKRILDRFEQEVRFIPKILIGRPILDPSETVAVWTIGGFSEPARAPAEAIGLPAPADSLLAAVSAILQEG